MEQGREPTNGNRTRATLVGGECSHHCAIPAPQKCVHAEILYQASQMINTLYFRSECLVSTLTTNFTLHYLSAHTGVRVEPAKPLTRKETTKFWGRGMS